METVPKEEQQQKMNIAKKKVKVKGKMMKIPFFQSCNSTEALMKRENTMHDDNDIASQKDTHRTKQKSKQNYANT